MKKNSAEKSATDKKTIENADSETLQEEVISKSSDVISEKTEVSAIENTEIPESVVGKSMKKKKILTVIAAVLVLAVVVSALAVKFTLFNDPL